MANKFPFVFDKPFASEGDFVLPKFEADPKFANWPQGFSGRFSEPPEDGGLFIEREAMNGIYNALSQNQAWQQSGQLPTFDPAYVAKSGGYPRGAVLWNIPKVWTEAKPAYSRVLASPTSWMGIEHRYLEYTQVQRFPVALVSTIDNNTANFVENQQYISNGISSAAWALLDYNAVIETGRTKVGDDTKGFSEKKIMSCKVYADSQVRINPSDIDSNGATFYFVSSPDATALAFNALSPFCYETTTVIHSSSVPVPKIPPYGLNTTTWMSAVGYTNVSTTYGVNLGTANFFSESDRMAALGIHVNISGKRQEVYLLSLVLEARYNRLTTV